jgi:hypothetical protein
VNVFAGKFKQLERQQKVKIEINKNLITQILEGDEIVENFAGGAG